MKNSSRNCELRVVLLDGLWDRNQSSSLDWLLALVCAIAFQTIHTWTRNLVCNLTSQGVIGQLWIVYLVAIATKVSSFGWPAMCQKRRTMSAEAASCLMDFFCLPGKVDMECSTWTMSCPMWTDCIMWSSVPSVTGTVYYLQRVQRTVLETYPIFTYVCGWRFMDMFASTSTLYPRR